MSTSVIMETSAGQCGISLPYRSLVREATEFVRDTESEMLFNHSSRVYCFGAFMGARKGLIFDPELLYVGAMFHGLGFTQAHRSAQNRFEIDGANAAVNFLRQRGFGEEVTREVWTAIALHATPENPQYMNPVIALVSAGFEMDVFGLNYADFSTESLSSVIRAFPRSSSFKEDIIDAFYEDMKCKSQTAFWNAKADVMADKENEFRRGNFCDVVRMSHWAP